jgi:hypothetical protein
MQRLRVLAYQTASQLKYCSPLGGLLVKVRLSQGLKGVGEKTIQQLEAIGMINFATLAQLTDEQFVATGISRNLGSRYPCVRAAANALSDQQLSGQLKHIFSGSHWIASNRYSAVNSDYAVVLALLHRSARYH